MPLAEVLKPAIEYAERGFPVSEIIAAHWQAYEPILHGSGYLVNEHAPRPGQIFRNPDLANSLRRIAEQGRDGYYKGPTADAILAIEKEVPGVAEDQFTEELLRAEAAKAWELYQAGILREAYFTADTHEAVLILECADAGEARSRLSELPLVRAGLIDFNVLPLAPYPGFERLFRGAA